MQNMVAVYPTREKAEQVREVLIDSGVPVTDIELSPERSISANVAAEDRPRGFWDFLFGPGGIFGSDVPDEHRSWYQQNLTEGRTALCVHLQQDELHDRVGEILHGHEPMEPPARRTAATLDSGTTGASAGATADAEQRIPLVKEDLEVGKRQTETRYRVRVYMTERPVEETVTLRDEKVVVERRPVSGRVGASPDAAPREFDVVERHERPVVNKTARVDEEVVVHKEVREREEVVRDKVKETKVDLDKSGSGARR